MRAPCEDVAIPCPSGKRLRKDWEIWVLVATILGSSMAFIDATIVNVALPAIQNALHASISQMQWVIEAYALFLGALLLVGGAMGDIYGRRIIFLIGTVAFTVSSICCGLALTVLQLIVARAIQGMGAALLVPGSLALITACFPKERRGHAIGTWSGFTAITTATGPVVGGWLVQHASWRWIFFLNIPLAIVVILITLFRVPESKSDQRHTLDLGGTFLATLGLGAMIFGLIEWHQGGTVVFVAEIIGICALIGFLFIEAHISSPIVPLEIFRSRNFTAANIVTCLLYFSLYGILFFFPIDLIQIRGYSATEAGAALLPFILLMFLLSRWSGGLVKRFGPRLPLVVGPTIAALGLALFIPSNAGSSYWTSFFPATFVLGLGMAISVAPLTTVVMNSATENYAGAASGINNAVSRIAGLLAIACLGFILTAIFNHELMARLNKTTMLEVQKQEIIGQQSLLAAIKTNDPVARRIVQESFIAGYQVIIWIAVVLAFGSALCAAVLIRTDDLKGL